MFIASILLVACAICLCLAALRATLAVLRLDLMQTLMWLGLAELPAPRPRRRTRLA